MVGEEDCLYLSVYVPSMCTPESPFAVMQWIYGGAWIVGSNYKPVAITTAPPWPKKTAS